LIAAQKLKTYEATRFKPGFVSVKRNGVHGIFAPGLSYSRTPKKLDGLEHIEKALKDIKFPLVCEIVVPGCDFEEASGLIRNGYSTPQAEIFIFNSIIQDTIFRQRLLRTATVFEEHLRNIPFIHLEPMHLVTEEKEYDKFHNTTVNLQKHEGTCWISPYHIYQPGKRNWDWMKRVNPLSIEAEIIDILPGTKGKKYEHSMGRMLCKMTENHKHEAVIPVEFKVGIFKGKSDAWRQRIYNEKETHKGKYITVEFKDYTKYGVPSQARYKAFRKKVV